MRSGTNLPRVGGYNRAVILEAIRSGGQVSRVELAAQTGLTTQTVSNIVRHLLDENLVVEAGRLPSNGGKPRTRLALNPEAAYAVGVHLDPDATVTVLTDLAGTVVARRRRASRPGARPATALAQLAAGVEAVVARAGVPAAAVVGVGVACPGPVDPSRGLVVRPPNLATWHEVPLVDELSDRLGLTVVLDNDTTAMAVGERWAGGRAGPFAFVYLGAGVGGGLVLADGVHRGETGNAGEFGHLVVVPGGRPCHCGNRGCLEAYVAPRALVASLVSGYPEAAARLDVTGGTGRLRTDLAHLASGAAGGDAAAREILDEATALLAQASVSLVNLLDLRRLVLGGDALRHLGAFVLPAVRDAVNRAPIARWVRTVTVERSVLGDDAGAIGAASLVLHGAYAPGWTQLLATGVA